MMEMLPILDDFAESNLLKMAARVENVVTEGRPTEFKPRTRLALYPNTSDVAPRFAIERPGPSRAILLDPPVSTDNILPLLYIGAKVEWLEKDEVYSDKEVIARFEQLRRQLLKCMVHGPFEGFSSKGSHVYRGTHYSPGALEWFNAGGEWASNFSEKRTRFRPVIPCL